MAESHVVSALVAKRGELAGDVQRHRRELQRLDEQLGHLDAAIRLFAPDYDLRGCVPANAWWDSVGSLRGNANAWCWRRYAMHPSRSRIGRSRQRWPRARA
jgi:hypothetical protein